MTSKIDQDTKMPQHCSAEPKVIPKPKEKRASCFLAVSLPMFTQSLKMAPRMPKRAQRKPRRDPRGPPERSTIASRGAQEAIRGTPGGHANLMASPSWMEFLEDGHQSALKAPQSA